MLCVLSEHITQPLFFGIPDVCFWLHKHKQNHPDSRGRTRVTASKLPNENNVHKPSSAADYKHASLTRPLQQKRFDDALQIQMA